MINLKAEYESLKQKKPELFVGLETPVVLDIAEGDGMFNPGEGEYYLMAGLWANQVIQTVLKQLFVSKSEIGSILDFACGYGRVSRFLKSSFPSARLVLCDLDKKAVDASAKILNCERLYGERNLESLELGKRFDLIWVGSLFTHVSKEYTEVLLRFFERHLASSGVLVFTTHGQYVADRIRSREKTYGLNEMGAESLIGEFEKTGFAFQAYPNLADYGISIATPSVISEIIEKQQHLEQIMFLKRGWLRHQDAFACVKA